MLFLRVYLYALLTALCPEDGRRCVETWTTRTSRRDSKQLGLSANQLFFDKVGFHLNLTVLGSHSYMETNFLEKIKKKVSIYENRAVEVNGWR